VGINIRNKKGEVNYKQNETVVFLVNVPLRPVTKIFFINILKGEV